MGLSERACFGRRLNNPQLPRQVNDIELEPLLGAAVLLDFLYTSIGENQWAYRHYRTK